MASPSLRKYEKSIESEDDCTTRRAQQASKMRRRLGAGREELVRRRVVYALVCEEKNDRVVERSKMAEYRRRKKG